MAIRAFTVLFLLLLAGTISAQPEARSESVEDLLNGIDSLSIKELALQLGRVRRIDRNGQLLMRHREQARVIIVELQERISYLESREGVKKCLAITETPAGRARLAGVKRITDAKAKQEAFIGLLREENLQQIDFQEMNQLRARREELADAQTVLESVMKKIEANAEKGDVQIDFRMSSASGTVRQRLDKIRGALGEKEKEEQSAEQLTPDAAAEIDNLIDGVLGP